MMPSSPHSTACPDLVTLHALFDGELPGDDVLELDEHVRECSPCRDFLRQLSVVDRSLRRHRELPASDDFEDRFLEGLMDRMVTADESRGLLRSARTGRLALSAAAAILIAVGILGWLARDRSPNSSDDMRPSRIEVVEGADRAKGRESALTELTRLLAGPNVTAKALQGRLFGLRSRFRASGASLDSELSRLLRGDDHSLRKGALAAVKERGQRRFLADLRQLLAQGDLGALDRVRVLETAIDIDPESAAKLIRVESEKRRLDSDVALTLMVKTNEMQHIEPMLRRLQVAGADELERLLGVLAPVAGDERTSRFLLDMYLDGMQSGRLTKMLSAGSRFAPLVRTEAERRNGQWDRRRRAILLLGLMKDFDSIDALARLTRHRRLGGAALRALGEMGVPDARLAVARCIRVGASTARVHDAVVASVVSSMGESGAKLFIETAATAETRTACRLVKAGGMCGTDRQVDSLVELGRRDDLRLAVVSALAKIGSKVAINALQQWRHDPDHRVRGTVRKAIGPATNGTRRSGSYV